MKENRSFPQSYVQYILLEEEGKKQLFLSNGGSTVLYSCLYCGAMPFAAASMNYI
jgi:hypothetical protein